MIPVAGDGSVHALQHLLIVLHVQLDSAARWSPASGRGRERAARFPSLTEACASSSVTSLTWVLSPALFSSSNSSVECARIVAHLRDHGMQAAQQFGRVGRQQAIGMPRVNIERFVILPEAGATLRQQKQPLGIVVHREQFLRDRGGLGQSSRSAGTP